MKTRFPDWPRERLEKTAIRHACDVALHYARAEVSDAPVDQLVVNMLRHEFTSYDESQTLESHGLACEAIAARYPWLADECRRQAEARARREREEASLAAGYADFMAEQKARVSESLKAIGQFSAGMRVVATVKGHQRDAVVVKTGRSRVTVSFRLKSGAERTAAVYAAELVVPGG
jgi:hypothetical protein